MAKMVIGQDHIVKIGEIVFRQQVASRDLGQILIPHGQIHGTLIAQVVKVKIDQGKIEPLTLTYSRVFPYRLRAHCGRNFHFHL